MSCFVDSGLEYVTIPSKVSSINSGIFTNCLYLKNVVYPENCNVSKAEIGEGVTKVTYKVEDDKVTITGITPGTRRYEFVQPAEISGYTDYRSSSGIPTVCTYYPQHQSCNLYKKCVLYCLQSGVWGTSGT